MSLEELQDLEWVKAHLNEVYRAQQIIDTQLWLIKDEVKLNRSDTQYWGVTLKFTSYVKLKPRDLNTILAQYPLQEYPDVYNVTLSKDAQHIITDEGLFDTVQIDAVRIELPE